MKLSFVPYTQHRPFPLEIPTNYDSFGTHDHLLYLLPDEGTLSPGEQPSATAVKLTTVDGHLFRTGFGQVTIHSQLR
jgi:hypothetical protein